MMIVGPEDSGISVKWDNVASYCPNLQNPGMMVFCFMVLSYSENNVASQQKSNRWNLINNHERSQGLLGKLSDAL